MEEVTDFFGLSCAVFQEATRGSSSQHEGERARDGFQKAGTSTHEDNEGKSRLTATQQPGKQLVQLEAGGRTMASEGMSQGKSFKCRSA